MLALAELTGEGGLTEGTPASARRTMAESIAIAEDPIEDAPTWRPLEVAGATGTRAARMYTPRDAEEGQARPAIVFFHGGGWVTGDLDTHHTWCLRLAKLSAVPVIAVSYRLAPEHPFPAAIDDALASFEDIVTRSAALGLDATRLAVAGDSAGGNLAAGVSLATRSRSARPCLAVLIYPALDATLTWPSITDLGDGFLLTRDSLHWYMDRYLSGPARDTSYIDPRLSPLHTKDVSGAPPTLVSVAGFDPLRDEALDFARKLRAAGVTVETHDARAMVHGYLLCTGLSRAARQEAEHLARRTGQLLRAGT
jgi:acetyl esterase